MASLTRLMAFTSLVATTNAALDGSRFLWYNKPAPEWEKGSLPIGNSRLAGTVYGSLTDIFTINEDTIWSGPLQDRTPYGSLEVLEEARQFFLDGNMTDGGNFVLEEMNAENDSQRQYSYFGNLDLNFGHSDVEVEEYIRWLDTRQGHTGVSYTYGGVNYTREYVASFPDDVLAAHFTASEEGSLSLNASFSRATGIVSNEATVQDGVATLLLKGTSGQPAEEGPILFTGKARFVVEGGDISASGSTVVIQGASAIDVFFDAETNYRYPDEAELDAEVGRKVDAAVDKGYETVRNNAIEDATSLLDRASLDLGASPDGLADLPTDERVANARTNADDIQLVTLVWNLGRHLLVGSSRNTPADVDMPANLQGVWNNRTTAAWGGKYTININIEMNYWVALVTNLLETQEPLFDLMRVAEPRGRKIAQDMYGCEGIMYHHNLDLWADPAPTDKYRASSMWPMGAAWLVQHMIEHYRYTGDKEFLRDVAYPYVVDVATFFECYTFELDGYRVTGPTLSPENDYLVPEGWNVAGQREPMDVNVAMDDQLMRDVFRAVIEAASALDIPDDDEVVVRAQEFLPLIRPSQIGSKGQILEWRQEYAEAARGHRHHSHLYALHPGTDFSPLVNETLAEAAGVSVDARLDGGSGSTGWSLTWMINLYARLFRGDDAWARIQDWFVKFPTAGLWNTDKGATFQIDGNFGLTSGVTELLLQSHVGVHILPALPTTAIPTGSATGLSARGNFEIDIEWEDGIFKTATVLSKIGSELTLRVQDGIDILVDGEAYEGPIQTEAGVKYVVTPA